MRVELKCAQCGEKKVLKAMPTEQPFCEKCFGPMMLMSVKTSSTKKCECGKPAKEHWDNGLSCGDSQCDECFAEMVRKCRQRSY